jgi:prevent-host-death family protein
MKSFSAKEAKYGFGRLIDLARAAPVTILKHGRPVVVVMAIEEFERLKAGNKGMRDQPEAPMQSIEEK